MATIPTRGSTPPAAPERRNLGMTALVDAATLRKEVVRLPSGGIVASSGAHTGRSPMDKFIVREAGWEDSICWRTNQEMDPEAFARLRTDMLMHLRDKAFYSQDLFACAAPEHRLKVRVCTEFAWHSLFIRHLLRRPDAEDLGDFVPDFTIIDLPSFHADPKRHGCRSDTVIAISFEQRLVLVGGTGYAGEMKKSVFSILNHLLPAKGVMPMHCSANHAHGDPNNSAVFFGLSGTGKTTLSASPERVLIGDDEHGWAEGSLFNFEGGCYAKTYQLSARSEPDIYEAINQFGSVLENVAVDPSTGEIDLRMTP